MGLDEEIAIAVADTFMEVDRLLNAWDGRLSGTDPKIIDESFVIELLKYHAALTDDQAQEAIRLLEAESLSTRPRL